METDLRPLTLGEILDRTAQLYRTNFLLFAGIFAVTNGVVLVMVVVFEALSPGYRTLQTTMKFQIGPSLYFLAALCLVGMLFYGASIAAITRAVAWVHVGEPATIRSAYASTLPRLGRYLWLMVLAGLILLGIGLLAALAMGIVMVIVLGGLAIVFGGSKPAAAAAAVAIIVGLLIDVAFFAVIAWFATRYSLGIPACVVESLKARKALRRSVELSKGSRGRIFLLFLLVGVIQIGLYLLTQVPFFVYTFAHHLHLSLGLSILSQIISVFTNTLVGPILATGLTLFYFDQRIRKEGYDIEWMMAAAGMAETGMAETTAPALGPGTEITPAANPLVAPPPQPVPEVLSPGDTV